MPGWQFLTNHSLVLCLIAQQPRITAREISSTIGITEKATRNIINDLEADGYVKKKREGRHPGNALKGAFTRTWWHPRPVLPGVVSGPLQNIP